MESNLNQAEQNLDQKTNGFKQSFLAGILVVFNSALLGVASARFPQIVPTLPGSSGNDPIVLFSLSAFGLVFGALILTASMLLRFRPTYKKVWGVMVSVFSLFSIITGGGFIIGLIFGVLGGKKALTSKQHTKSSKEHSD